MREYSINVDDYEKLKIKVAEQLEEKEEQYLNEKQIICGLLTIHTACIR